MPAVSAVIVDILVASTVCLKGLEIDTQKSKEMIDFDGSSKKYRIKNIVIDIRYYTE